MISWTLLSFLSLSVILGVIWIQNCFMDEYLFLYGYVYCILRQCTEKNGILPF